MPHRWKLGIAESAEELPRFLTFAVPTVVAGSSIATTFDALSAAHRNCARVRFRYRSGKTQSEREVEPYRVLVRSGRYYLIGYDVAPRKGWRYSALDQIDGSVSRAGTFTPRTIPATYRDCDAVGMLQGGPSIDVTIHLSSVVAPSATSRCWQKGQQVTMNRDGSTDITFTVNDVGEAVRWALGFGSEAEVIAPPSAVQAARQTITDLQRAYASTPGQRLAV